MAETARSLFAGLDLGSLAEAVAGGHRVATGERIAGGDVLRALPELPVLQQVADRLGVRPDDPTGRIASAVELALESLYLSKKLAKDTEDDRSVYG